MLRLSQTLLMTHFPYLPNYVESRRMRYPFSCMDSSVYPEDWLFGVRGVAYLSKGEAFCGILQVAVHYLDGVDVSSFARRCYLPHVNHMWKSFGQLKKQRRLLEILRSLRASARVTASSKLRAWYSLKPQSRDGE